MKILSRTTAALSLLITTAAFAQTSPGAVENQSAWIKQGNQGFVSNYTSIDLLTAFNDPDVENFKFEESSTLFFVLKPIFQQSSGDLFLRFGDISIYDDHLDYGRLSVPINYRTNRPVIITLEMQRSSHYALRSNRRVRLGDSTLFNLAEVIVYPGILNRAERRKVNSHLALKYGIPITENSVPIWRNYLDKDNEHYWDTRIDRLYKERVLAIGRSDVEEFNQTQTIAETDSEFWACLDGFEPQGEMARVGIYDEAFIILSERKKSQALNLVCGSILQPFNPIYEWKLKLINWQSDATGLLIRIAKSKQSPDSLFLTDGQNYFFVPEHPDSGDFRSYRVNLLPLQNDRHYFFSEGPSKDCDHFTTETNEGLVTGRVDPSDDTEWRMEVQSLQDGSSQSHLMRNGTAHIPVGSGQYAVYYINANSGEVVDMHVVMNETDLSREELSTENIHFRIYPNPAGSGQQATIEVSNLPSLQDLRLVVTDASGKITQERSLTYRENLTETLTETTPGLYTVSLFQGQSVYSVKLIIRSNQ